MLVGFNPKGSEAPPAPVMSSCVPPTVPSVTHKPERPLGPGLEKERCLGVALAHVVLALVVIVMDHVHCAWVTSPAGAFFRRSFCIPALTAAPRLTQLSFFKYNQTVVKAAFLPVFKCIHLTLNLI